MRIQGENSVASEGELCYLKWQTYQGHISSGLQRLYTSEDTGFLKDVTLGSEGQYVKAHKVILSLCSPYFRQLFQTNRAENGYLIIVLEHLKFKDLKNVIHFIYNGEIKVKNSDLEGLYRAGELLQIEGLAKGNSDDNDDEVSPPPNKFRRTGSIGAPSFAGASASCVPQPSLCQPAARMVQKNVRYREEGFGVAEGADGRVLEYSSGCDSDDEEEEEECTTVSRQIKKERPESEAFDNYNPVSRGDSTARALVNEYDPEIPNTSSHPAPTKLSEAIGVPRRFSQRQRSFSQRSVAATSVSVCTPASAEPLNCYGLDNFILSEIDQYGVRHGTSKYRPESQRILFNNRIYRIQRVGKNGQKYYTCVCHHHRTIKCPGRLKILTEGGQPFETLPHSNLCLPA